ncbi:MAG: hypothetical protein IPN95_00580 [Bacteroidetes bacterium]|nr:hypothetical protein [Bacteroidota bacterium]
MPLRRRDRVQMQPQRPDACSEIYANNGDRQGRCYYSTRQVDPICENSRTAKPSTASRKTSGANPR